MTDLSHKYLRVQDLRRLRNLLFSTRRVVEGRFAGRHVSSQRGQSVEFTDHRPYALGDEVGDIDWKIYGRSDKLFVRLFEHQSDMSVHLLIDASASMAYSGLDHREPSDFDVRPTVESKYDHACRIAAAIAFLATRQQDRISFGFAKAGLREFQPPGGSPGHLLGLLDAMERLRPQGEARLSKALAELASRVHGRGVLVVLSDLHEDPSPVLGAMSLFAHRGGEVVVFHTLHGDELALPEMDDALFVDSETQQRLPLNVSELRNDYAKRMRGFLEGWSTACRGRGFDYQLVNSAAHYHQALEKFLFSRAAAG